MSQVPVTVRVGSTEPLDFQLRGDNDPVDLSGTGIEMRFKLVDAGTVFSYDTTDNPTIVKRSGSTVGGVRYNPSSGLGVFDSESKTCDVFFKVTDIDGNYVIFPTNGFVRINVEDVF